MTPRQKLSEQEKLERQRKAKREYAQRRRAQQKQVIAQAKENAEREKDMKYLYAISPELYPTKPRLEKDQKEFIASMMNRPIEPSAKKKNASERLAREQLGKAQGAINKGNPSAIDFDLTGFDNIAKQYFFDRVGDVIKNLLESIDLEDQWTVYYEYGGDVNSVYGTLREDTSEMSWKHRTLDSITSQFLLDQVEDELKDNRERVVYNDEYDSGRSFFPISIKSLTQLRFVNESKVGVRGRAYSGKLTVKDFSSRTAFKVYQDLVDSGADKTVIDKFLKKSLIRNKRGGKFWRWHNTLPEVNLEKYMIFNRLDQRTVQIVERDNCFVYACKMAGVGDDVLDEMRKCIKKRSFGIADIEEVAISCWLSFEIKTTTHKVHVDAKAIRKKLLSGSSSKKELLERLTASGNREREDDPMLIKLLLIRDHYMFNERVPVSPYYILHRDEILNDKLVRYWKREDRLRIVKREGKYYQRGGESFSLHKVLDAMFEAGAFKPITSGEFMTFNSLICFENIDPIKKLEYSERFCCRLKQPRETK